MLTQQELVDRLNQLTLRYNLTWFDIKYDADKAITKINNFLGAKYPKLTQYMIAPTSTYSIPTFFKVGYIYDSVTYQADSVSELQTVVTEAGGPTLVEENIIKYSSDYEIIPEEYFHSVIIPYIAMEVLSRDEEFTTIYNKYTVEVQDGLYDMFQKEFNRIPFEFRQNPDQGVFFPLETQEGISQHNQRNLNVPTFKFKITYYPNKSDIAITDTFTTDPRAYTYDEEATLLFWPVATKLYSTDYSKVYSFKGWSREANVNQAVYIEPTAPLTTKIKMRENIKLYAIWEAANTLTINTTLGTKPVSILAAHRASLVNLVIPEFVNGVKPLTIPTDFITSNQPSPLAADLLKAVYLPEPIRTLDASSFGGFQGNIIQLNEGLTTIRTNAFASTPNLIEIIIPLTVTTIEANAFPVINGKHLVIKARILEANKPSTWVANWYAASTNDYTVEIIWGYNGA
jgi:hypothetical protein